jgi:hypothetical protein
VEIFTTPVPFNAHPVPILVKVLVPDNDNPIVFDTVNVELLPIVKTVVVLEKLDPAEPLKVTIALAPRTNALNVVLLLVVN